MTNDRASFTLDDTYTEGLPRPEGRLLTDVPGLLTGRDRGALSASTNLSAKVSSLSLRSASSVSVRRRGKRSAVVVNANGNVRRKRRGDVVRKKGTGRKRKSDSDKNVKS